jgi:hypothetical protein
MPAKISISIRKHHPLDIIDIDSERERERERESEQRIK